MTMIPPHLRQDLEEKGYTTFGLANPEQNTNGRLNVLVSRNEQMSVVKYSSGEDLKLSRDKHRVSATLRGVPGVAQATDAGLRYDLGKLVYEYAVVPHVSGDPLDRVPLTTDITDRMLDSLDRMHHANVFFAEEPRLDDYVMDNGTPLLVNLHRLEIIPHKEYDKRSKSVRQRYLLTQGDKVNLLRTLSTGINGESVRAQLNHEETLYLAVKHGPAIAAGMVGAALLGYALVESFLQ